MQVREFRPDLVLDADVAGHQWQRSLPARLQLDDTLESVKIICISGMIEQDKVAKSRRSADELYAKALLSVDKLLDRCCDMLDIERAATGLNSYGDSSHLNHTETACQFGRFLFLVLSVRAEHAAGLLSTTRNRQKSPDRKSSLVISLLDVAWLLFHHAFVNRACTTNGLSPDHGVHNLPKGSGQKK